ncbi:class A basic helix-loop-helix protein 15 isoform X2 [Thunnus thynnus]|uniref:class A basic helix-loop-helix protein 15 isoform X2 n=1 Tax=Thunnus thynnus TaxID=8237 RepID=UPI0035294370
MSGARRMQELKYFRGGATLVVSLDGLNWLTKRKCKKRDEELQLWISSGEMMQADEELQPITCFCILAQRGSAAPQLWRNKDSRSSLVSRSSPFFLSLFSPRHCCLPRVPICPSTFTSSFASKCPEEALWTRFILNMRDIFSVITKDLNMTTHQDTITMNQHNKFIIFYNEDIPPQFFSDFCYAQDCWKSIGNTFCNSDNSIVSSDLKDFTSHWLDSPNTDSSKEYQSEMVVRDNLNTCKLKSLLKSCQNYNHPGKSSGMKRNIKKKKTVSFVEDVVVYLFDQESPTLELHSETCTSLPGNLPDVTLEDSGLEWEDDFSALEKNCQFQCVRRSVSQHYTLSLPTQSWTSMSEPEPFFLSQTCLYLTHVTESDLEL